MNHKNKLLEIKHDLIHLSEVIDLEIARLKKSGANNSRTNDKEYELMLIHFESKKLNLGKQICVLDKMIEHHPISKKEFDLLMKDNKLALYSAINRYSNILRDQNNVSSPYGNRRTSNDLLFVAPRHHKTITKIDEFLTNAKAYAQHYFTKRKK